MIVSAGCLKNFVGRLRARTNTRLRIQPLMPTSDTRIDLIQLIIGVFASIVLVEVMYLLVLIWHLAIAAIGLYY
jgi:hypothetical protein